MQTNNELTFNILAFQHVSERIPVLISDGPLPEGSFKLSERDAKHLAPMIGLPAGTGGLFAGLVVANQTDTREVELAVSPRNCQSDEKYWSISFLKKYYTFMLTKHFKELGMPVQTNFVSDTDVWVKCSSPYPNCQGYRVFSLRVQFSAPAYQPELVVIVGGVHSVLNKPIRDTAFSEISEENFGKVLYNNEIHHIKYLPDAARREMDKVYPCMNLSLLHIHNT